MNEPQVWTLIGVFGAALFGMLTLMSTMFVRTVQTEIRSVRTEIGSVRTEIGTEIASLRSEMGTEIASLRTEMSAELKSIRTEIGGLHGRIDRLDSDISGLMRHTFGIERG